VTRRAVDVGQHLMISASQAASTRPVAKPSDLRCSLRDPPLDSLMRSRITDPHAPLDRWLLLTGGARFARRPC
jgi:hypothetical protein